MYLREEINRAVQIRASGVANQPDPDETGQTEPLPPVVRYRSRYYVKRVCPFYRWPAF
jgi:hypothetical protein